MKKEKSLLIVYKFSLIFILIILEFIIIIKMKNLVNLNKSNEVKKEKNCFLSPENSDKKIIHLIITRFMSGFYKRNGFNKIIYTKDYLNNAIRVMKKFLIPSLKYQKCRDFIWLLRLGNKANITYLRSLLNFSMPFKFLIIYQKNMKNFIRNITKNIDVLITTRIDYDDRIYFDAVNDVRKTVNVSKPIFLYGYDRGYTYFEEFDIYTGYYCNFNNKGAMSVFESLIIVLNKVNDVYTIFDLGPHPYIKRYVLKNLKKFGLQKLDYEPAIFEKKVPKFVWVRQRYSGSFVDKRKPKKKVNFDINKFYGIKKYKD